jgi:addiction module HigA family antidote
MSRRQDRPAITRQETAMAEKEFVPVTPGEMLKEEFLDEYGLLQNRLARAVGISPNRVAEIINNRRRITADTALRLSLYFGNSAEFWMNLQTHYDLKMARRNLKPEDAKRIKARVPGTCANTPRWRPAVPRKREKRAALRGYHERESVPQRPRPE